MASSTVQNNNDGDHKIVATMDATEPTTIHNNDNENPTVASGIARLQERQRPQKPALSKQEYLLIGVMCMAVVAIVLALGLVFGLKQDVIVVVAEPASSSSSSSPSMVPSSVPTSVMDLLLENLPDYTLKSLQNSSTPQWKAMQWLSDHPDIAGLEEWRKMQLFALATFFYSMEGPMWPDIIRSNWMEYTRHECDWFSSAFLTDVSSMTVSCNELGEYHNINLSALKLAGLQPMVPPEITLLTSLQGIGLSSNSINSAMLQLFPLEFYHSNDAERLKSIHLADNRLTGAIPSEMGLLAASLEILELQTNALSEIPRELGMLTNLLALKCDLQHAVDDPLGARHVDSLAGTLTPEQ